MKVNSPTPARNFVLKTTPAEIVEKSATKLVGTEDPGNIFVEEVDQEEDMS